MQFLPRGINLQFSQFFKKRKNYLKIIKKNFIQIFFNSVFKMDTPKLDDWEVLFDNNETTLDETKKTPADQIQELDQDIHQIQFLFSKRDFHQEQQLQSVKNEENNLNCKPNRELNNLQNEHRNQNSKNVDTQVVYKINSECDLAKIDCIQNNQQLLMQKDKIIIQDNKISQRNQIQDLPKEMLDNNQNIKKIKINNKQVPQSIDDKLEKINEVQSQLSEEKQNEIDQNNVLFIISMFILIVKFILKLF
ncbi:hypothetical protein TTHERM_00620900 (macronuclear) [Tetrahymena thermophila SB210]|uniref:Uncharacterized protein n=1 Tax=Tetrahymena thermophila (strain SB210) TaxID=312017 RepID=Q23MG9_TETTS|nr:hypothetical protein TTHERM_00620900 [Tetrahymena thermophila SB210]EAR97670.2 hypothetical protein TTHERM_00620900 [Tetrahymena thermophila SB210]|eukprot:XP_001017915.2 hypothetical protein TTHERM_00620900 [Tetrahymena thermophila SB210]